MFFTYMFTSCKLVQFVILSNTPDIEYISLSGDVNTGSKDVLDVLHKIVKIYAHLNDIIFMSESSFGSASFPKSVLNIKSVFFLLEKFFLIQRSLDQLLLSEQID